MAPFLLQKDHPNKRSVQVGRGGKRGKTSGRGGKGQTARAGHKVRPEMRDVIKRLPKLRGRGKNSFKGFAEKPAIVSLEALTIFADGALVSPATLLENGLISKRSGNIPAVKILGDGELTKKITVEGCAVSKSAKEKIEAVGGAVNTNN